MRGIIHSRVRTSIAGGVRGVELGQKVSGPTGVEHLPGQRPPTVEGEVIAT